MSSLFSFIIDLARTDLPNTYVLLKRMNVSTVGLIGGEGVDGPLHATQIHEHLDGKATVFYQDWSPDRRWWRKYKPRDVINGYNVTHRRGLRGFVWDVDREPEIHANELADYLDWSAGVAKLAREEGIDVGVCGFSTAFVDHRHVETGVYDSLLWHLGEYQQRLIVHDYTYGLPEAGVGALQPRDLLDEDKMRWHNLPSLSGVQYPNWTLRHNDVLWQRAQQLGMKPFEIVVGETGWDVIDAFKNEVEAELIRRYGIPTHSTGHPQQTLRGYRTWEYVWRAWWPEFSFQEAVVKQLEKFDSLYADSGVPYIALWLFILANGGEWDYPNGMAFETDPATLEAIAQYVADKNKDTPDMPDKPIEIEHPSATDAGWRWYHVSSTGNVTNIRKGPATSAVTIDTIPASGRMLQLNMAHKLTLTDGVWIPASPAGWVREDVVRLEPGEPGTIDALPYLRGNGQQYRFSSGERMRAEHDANRWYQVKNHQFEEMWFDTDYIYRGLDTSPGNSEVYILYERDPRQHAGYGSIWMPRFVNVGDTFKRGAWVQFRQKPNGQPIDGKTYFHESTLKVEALHPHFTFPSGVTLWDVLELRGVDADGPFETYYYARDFGLVMWKNLRDGKTFHVTQINVTAPPLERESLTWWETMDKTYPPPPAPEPTPDIDELVNERVRDRMLTFLDELEETVVQPLNEFIERTRQELK